MTKDKLKKFATLMIVFFGIILIVLAILVHFRNILGTDIFLSKDLQAEGDTPERQTIIYHTLYAISLFGKPLISAIMVALFALLFWIYKYYRETIYIIFTPLSVLINSLVKIVVNRPRPTADLVKILAIETDKSFPSGHVNFYTVFFGFLIITLFFTPKIPKAIRYFVQVASIILIISISFSRVYLGVHWVTDTLGGYLLGGIILCFFIYFYLRPKLKLVSKS
ncbi:MAG: phosphatase PAP2 family protein [Candidatus Berkelbacteria bacterium]|nr:phosphatase PAP2 family protein [Candidatus Berkelbacteria bacterium]